MCWCVCDHSWCKNGIIYKVSSRKLWYTLHNTWSLRILPCKVYSYHIIMINSMNLHLCMYNIIYSTVMRMTNVHWHTNTHTHTHSLSLFPFFSSSSLPQKLECFNQHELELLYTKCQALPLMWYQIINHLLMWYNN